MSRAPAPPADPDAIVGGAEGDLWVFAYGSLMWRPGFAFAEVCRARLSGYSRRFCVTSVHHRGSPERPGLVLGLDRGGVCDGLLYRVPAAEAAATLGYLREREQVNGVYRETRLDVRPGREAATVQAVAYLVERAHPSYVPRLPLHLQARLIAGARGRSGVNLDYLVNTLRHMRQIGIREPELERLLSLIGGIFGRCTTPPCGRQSDSGPVSARAEALCRCRRSWPQGARRVRRLKPLERRRFGHRRQLG
ncbi:MAG: gamma-glutamylcyclotransferase [Hyphomicrobiaceae bacterium]